MKAAINTTVSDITAVCGGLLVFGDGNALISSITSDSRDVQPGSLFVPLAGERFDGHDFIADLITAGSISAFLTEKDGFEPSVAEKNIAVIRCDNALAALGKIAEAHRTKSNLPVIAITGTNGKTTTKEILHAALSLHFKTHKNEKNYNNEIGVPFAVLGINEEHEAAVFELGMNHAGEIHRLSSIVKPDIALITNVGEGHLEYLGDVENVARAKMEIIDGMRRGALLLLNRDSKCFEFMQETALAAGMKVKTFGLEGNADFYPEYYRMGADFVEVHFADTTVTAPLYGIHNVYNLTAAALVLNELGLSHELLKSAMIDFSLLDGRSQIIDKGYVIINDTYNSNPLSSESAIRSIEEIFPQRRKIAALSDMNELGDSAPECHRRIGALAVQKFDILCVWGKMTWEYLRGALGNSEAACKVMAFESKEEMAAYIKGVLTENDVVLVKGSRSMKMEEVTEFLIN